MSYKRASVFWTLALAELAVVAYALTSVPWGQAADTAPDATFAAATVAPATPR